MTRKYFGTDGIRGTANLEPMMAEVAQRVGMAAGRYFRRGDHRHRAVIGKDTRLSGYMLEPALTSGLISAGMDVVLVGPLPTPAIGMLTTSLRADIGVMLSASHNPYHDNGIKLFGPDGYKLSDEVELAIEELMAAGNGEGLAAPDKLGRAQRLDDAQGRYIEFVKSTFPKSIRLDDLKIVVDCAHGAAYKVAPTVLWELGADVVPIGVTPDGFNINDGCGSTSTEAMQSAVVANGADIGIALDGDADRVIIADENGEVLDGDQLMACIAEYWHTAGLLSGGGVVSTIMSNLALERYVEGLGLSFVRTQVGDRYVGEHMRQHGFNLGGEKSGHIILSDFATTGDGLMAALQIMATVLLTDKPVSEVCRSFEPLPQILRNVRINGGAPMEDKAVKAAVADAEKRLGDGGRLLIRPSGTEPLIRVMVEGEDPDLVASLVDDIAGAVERAAG